MTEQQLREQLVYWAKSLFNRGYSSGGAGNISAQLEDGSLLVTPTNSSFGTLDPEELSKINPAGKWVSGAAPTKELMMHQAMYQQRPDCRAVVHLHSPYLTALSCLAGLDPDDCLPPITPYFVMRVGKLPIIPYTPPGDPSLAEAVSQRAKAHNAMLLANHGPIVGGNSLRAAIFNAEELEETARLYMMLRPHAFNTLNGDEVAILEQRYRSA